MNNIKERIMEEIQKNSDIFIKVNPIQYRIRCPICGDSQKNLRDSHCYIKCSSDPAEPLLYHCFKCNSSGKVDKEFLNKLNIKNSNLIDQLGSQHYSKIGVLKTTNINIITGNPILDSPQTNYIDNRLGNGFSYDDYDKFKIIWDINSIREFITSERILHSLPNNNDSISFLSDDKTMVLTRSLDENGGWRKIKITRDENRAFYTIKALIDLFTKEDVIINITEGIFDALSAYKNFNDNKNSVFIAVLGLDYLSGIEYAIAKGFIGDNIIIRIYADSDVKIDKFFKNELKKYKWLFKSISIFQNIKYKDIGVKKELIELVEK